MNGSVVSLLLTIKPYQCSRKPCPFQIKLGGIMCNKSMRSRNKHHILGVAQYTLCDQKDPYSCHRSGNGVWLFKVWAREFLSACFLPWCSPKEVAIPHSERAVQGPPHTSEFVGMPLAEVTASTLCSAASRSLTAQAVLMNAFAVACRKPSSMGWLPRAVQLQGWDISPATHSVRCC